ncbi:hypothetical protein [Streptomyces ochraceiscleroticus]|uniref:DUF8094 domain-containing protein n=1 Tax=Streptomyces ochraceiscleroticus TaxID=47761 RepID=A0ABW1MFQ8_9ACTN|nr:hypothetical protein [Streptomyces ochraceiscleroticus]
MTVHGEREKIPALSKAEAGKVLKQFVAGYNKANTTLDPAVNATYETGALHDIDEAITKGGRQVSPNGNPGFKPLELSDARFAIPKQAGWPKFFVADTVSNRNNGHWFVAFTRNGIGEKWKAAYLLLLDEDEVPEFATDKDGHAEVVPAKGSGLTVDPGKLGKTYAKYLKTGEGNTFAPGVDTDGWRAQRQAAADRPGQHTETVDEPYKAPAMALRTKDGGALAFFATYHFQHRTLPAGHSFALKPAVEAVREGPRKKTNKMTFTTVSEQVVKVPAKDAGGGVVFLNRQGRTTEAKAD